MNQLILDLKNLVNTGNAIAELDLFISNATPGNFAFIDGHSIIDPSVTKSNFGIIYIDKNGKPQIFPEIDWNSLTVTKSKYQPKVDGVYSYSLADDLAKLNNGDEMTFTITKKGKSFNEKATWNFIINIDDVNSIMPQVAKQINNSNINIEVRNQDSTMQLISKDCALCATITYGTTIKEFTEATAYSPEVLGKADIKALAAKCAAGKGFNYLAEDGKELYSGYNIEPEFSQYDLYTFRFAVPRVSGKTRDEVVYQNLYIAIQHTLDNAGGNVDVDIDAVFRDKFINGSVPDKNGPSEA